MDLDFYSFTQMQSRMDSLDGSSSTIFRSSFFNDWNPGDSFFMTTGYEKNEQWPLSTEFNAFSDTRFWKPWIWIWLGPISSFSSISLGASGERSGIPKYSLKKEDLEIRKGFIQRIHSTLHLFKAVEIEIHTCASAVGGEAGLAESLPTAFMDLLEIREAYFLSIDSFPIHVFLQALHLEIFRILHWFQHSSAWHFSWCKRWKYWMDFFKWSFFAISSIVCNWNSRLPQQVFFFAIVSKHRIQSNSVPKNVMTLCWRYFWLFAFFLGPC